MAGKRGQRKTTPSDMVQGLAHIRAGLAYLQKNGLTKNQARAEVERILRYYTEKAQPSEHVTPRLTTAEVAQRLGCSDTEALQILKAASVPFARLGSRGAHLWELEGVNALLSALEESRRMEDYVF